MNVRIVMITADDQKLVSIATKASTKDGSRKGRACVNSVQGVGNCVNSRHICETV